MGLAGLWASVENNRRKEDLIESIQRRQVLKSYFPSSDKEILFVSV
jgi:hypothetical protein